MPATGTLLEDLTGAVTRDDSYVNAEVWLSTHSANPGSSGANELTSGTGSAGRQQLSYNSGGSGTDATNVEADIVIPGAQTIPWVGLWDSQTGGDFLGGYPLVGPSLTAIGINGSPLVFCPGHGLVAGQAVRLFNIPVGTSAIPAGLSGDPSIFYVFSVVSADELLLSTSPSGGSPVTMSSSGAFFIATDATETFSASGGLLVFSAGQTFYATVS